MAGRGWRETGGGKGLAGNGWREGVGGKQMAETGGEKIHFSLMYEPCNFGLHETKKYFSA